MTHYLHREHQFLPGQAPSIDTSDDRHYQIDLLTADNFRDFTNDGTFVGYYWCRVWDQPVTSGKALTPDGFARDYVAITGPDDHTRTQMNSIRSPDGTIWNLQVDDAGASRWVPAT